MLKAKERVIKVCLLLLAVVNIALWFQVTTRLQSTKIATVSVTPKCLYIKEELGKFDVENQCGGTISLTTTVPGVSNDVLGDGYQSWGDSVLLEKWLNSYLHTVVPLPFKTETDFRLGGKIGENGNDFTVTGTIATDIVYSMGFVVATLLVVLSLFIFIPSRAQKDDSNLKF